MFEFTGKLFVVRVYHCVTTFHHVFEKLNMWRGVFCRIRYNGSVLGLNPLGSDSVVGVVSLQLVLKRFHRIFRGGGAEDQFFLLAAWCANNNLTSQESEIAFCFINS